MMGDVFMEFVKLNIVWDAEPNAPMPKVTYPALENTAPPQCKHDICGTMENLQH